MNANEAKHEARVAERTKRVRECRSSGLSVKARCAEQGIKAATYYRWEHEVLMRADGGISKRKANHERLEGRPVFAEVIVGKRLDKPEMGVYNKRNNKEATKK